MAKFVKVILFLLLTVAFHSIAGNVSTAKVVDEQERAITYAMRQHGEISAPDLPGKPVAELNNLQSHQISVTRIQRVQLGEYFLAAYAINQMGIKMFGMTNDIPLAQQFAGYALVVTFLLHIVTGLLPDFSIIGWLLQFYIVYVVWEGARVVMLVEEKNRLRYTIFSSILLILCPAVIQVVFNKLTAILN